MPAQAPQPALARDDGDGGGSQSLRAQLGLREMVLAGELTPGARIAELQLVERLGVSRTPIRTALVRLEEEGLLESLPSGGFTVKAFSEQDIHDAIEVRGTLEGLAARLAAERGAPAALLAQARALLAELDQVLEGAGIDEASFTAYVRLNESFHATLLAMAGSAVLARQLERAMRLPFAGANAFLMVQASGPKAHEILRIAQDQHRATIDAIERREGARAEALMREHARIAHRNLQIALSSAKSLQLVPGATMIRRAGPGAGQPY